MIGTVENRLLCLIIVPILSLSPTAPEAMAHSGRGFEIEIAGGKLQAQGVNNGNSDGAPAVRPYVNSIHDHWSTYVESLNQSSSTFPEFEVTPQIAFTFLESYSLELELLDAWKWQPPELMPPPGTVPQLEPLDNGEVISIQTLGAPISTEMPGVIQLSTSVPVGGTGDVVPSYTINGSPSGRIHVLQFILSATPPDNSHPDFLPSDPIFLLLSPRGATPELRLHHASLYLEEYLGVNGIPVPEPSTLFLSSLAGVLICSRKRRG